MRWIGCSMQMQRLPVPKTGCNKQGEVNRVLKCGGKFICFTWAWSDVLGTQSQA
ncbi:hypothetical protein ACE6H2_001580 [Prunus campanulata]